jgi:heme oxygenase
MLIRLDMATRVQHASADEPWLDLMINDATRAGYMAQLRKTYGFEAPLEAALAYTPELSGVLDLRPRARVGLIAQDLLALGLLPGDVAQLPQYLEITPFRSTAEALGWLYVAERATLLHAYVQQHLLARFPDLAPATAYLRAYEGHVGLRWHELGCVLDDVARDDAIATQVVDAAHDAFAHQRCWQRGERAVLARGA